MMLQTLKFHINIRPDQFTQVFSFVYLPLFVIRVFQTSEIARDSTLPSLYEIYLNESIEKKMQLEQSRVDSGKARDFF